MNSLVPESAGVLDTIISVKCIDGIYRVEVSNARMFVGDGAFVYVGLGRKDGFFVRMISPSKAGNYLWTDEIPSGTKRGDLIVL